jgi:diacylglycerol kinase family enzyme
MAEQLRGTQIPLGIIPAGSANGMARELNLPLSVTDALDIVLNGIIKKIDLVLFNDKEISIHISDIGLNAFLIKYYSKNRLRGKWGYAKAVISVLWHRRLFHSAIQINGEKILRKVYMIVLANACSYGTGVVINPAGDLSDGKFEIILLKKIAVWNLVKTFLTNRPFDTDEIDVIQTSEVTITTRKKVYFQIDGEYRGKVNTLKASILPGALTLLLPAD